MTKIAVCDDNREERRLFSSFLCRYQSEVCPDLQFQAFSSGFSLLNAIDQGECFDIVLLDILMPGENGMDVARELRAGNAGIEILFLTSSPEFAVESYEVRASNYLLKPVSQETLFAALTRCLEELPQKQAFGFLIQSGTGQYTRILYSRLMYAEAMLKSIRFYLDDHTVVSSAMTFTELVRLLDPCPDFVRPHRSYVVNMRYIENIAKNELVLMNGNRIPLSRNRSAQVSRLFLDFAFSNSFVEGGAFHDLFL